MVDVNTTDLAATIENLQSQVKALSERLSLFEKPGAAKAGTAPANGAIAQKEAAPVIEPIPEDIVLVISAAIAAPLGERVHLRQIRLISSHSWAMQGRVDIQASREPGSSPSPHPPRRPRRGARLS
jgi:methylmalonyl-CoA carboxyltransferase 12S subunit